MSIIRPLGWMPVQREPEDISDVKLGKKTEVVRLTRGMVKGFTLSDLQTLEDLIVARYEMSKPFSSKESVDKEFKLQAKIRQKVESEGGDDLKMYIFVNQSAQRIKDILRRNEETKKRIKDNKQKLKEDPRQKLDEARKQLRLLVPEKKENVSERKFQKARKQLTKQTKDTKSEKEKLEKQIKRDETNLKEFGTTPKSIAKRLLKPVRDEISKKK